MTRSHKKKNTVRGSVNSHFDLRTWQCITLLVLLVVIYFWELLLGNAWLWEDFLYFSYPLRSFAATSMAQGQMPLWNPYTFNGMPFLADIQTAVFYLPLTALALFVKNGHLSPYWLQFVIIAHYPLAGASMFLLARSFGLRRVTSFFAGAVYMVSGFMITHAIHQQMITLVAWYPMTFFLFRKVLTTTDWRWVFACGLVLGHSIFAGYPQLSLYLYMYLSFYALYTFFAERRGKPLISSASVRMTIRVFVVLALSLTLAMIQFLPTFELADLSQRAQITFTKASEGSFGWSQFLTLLYPKLFGTAGAHGYNYWGPGTYWYFWETCMYIGIVPLGLLVLSPIVERTNRHLIFFWGMVVFALLYALGDNFFLYRFFYELPGFSKFRIPGRMGIWFMFAASLISAFVLETLIYGNPAPRMQRLSRRVLLGLAGAGAIVWILVSSGSLSHPPAGSLQLMGMLSKETNISLIIIIVSVTALWTITSRLVSLRVGFILLIGVFFIDMYHFGSDLNTSNVDPDQYFNRSGRLVSFLKQEGQKEIFRVNTRNTRGMVMDRNQGMVDRIFTMEGYTPLVLQRVFPPVASDTIMYNLLNAKYKTAVTPEGKLTLVPNPTYFPRAFFLYNYRVTHSEDELTRYLKSRDFDPGRTAVLEEDPGVTLPAIEKAPHWKAHITEYENNRIALDVDTPNKGILVLSEIFYPGWNATVDGREFPVYRTDYNLRGVFVEAGSHTVVWTFSPEPFKRGMIISMCSLVICCGGIVMVSRKRRPVEHAAGTEGA